MPRLMSQSREERDREEHARHMLEASTPTFSRAGEGLDRRTPDGSCRFTTASWFDCGVRYAEGRWRGTPLACPDRNCDAVYGFRDATVVGT
jgi:hypothetical protein